MTGDDDIEQGRHMECLRPNYDKIEIKIKKEKRRRGGGDFPLSQLKGLIYLPVVITSPCLNDSMRKTS